jgi:hypothetical protein
MPNLRKEVTALAIVELYARALVKDVFREKRRSSFNEQIQIALAMI